MTELRAKVNTSVNNFPVILSISYRLPERGSRVHNNSLDPQFRALLRTVQEVCRAKENNETDQNKQGKENKAIWNTTREQDGEWTKS